MTLQEFSKNEQMQGRHLKAHIDNIVKDQSAQVSQTKDQMKKVVKQLDTKIELKFCNLIKEIQERRPHLD